MKIRFAFFAALITLVVSVHADTKDLVGRWIGQVVTDKGNMGIALQLRLEKDTLVGALETGHGEWKVSSVSEKDGLITVLCESADGRATLQGRADAAKFAGKWSSHMANGAFELSRSKKP